jgi:hypothetical protein
MIFLNLKFCKIFGGEYPTEEKPEIEISIKGILMAFGVVFGAVGGPAEHGQTRAGQKQALNLKKHACRKLYTP